MNMRRGRAHPTPRQTAYAMRVWSGSGESKMQIARDVGYAASTANALASHVDNTKGVNMVIAKLAAESGGMAMEVLAEYRNRGLRDFTNKDLNGALNAIGSAWARFSQPLTRPEPQSGNKSGENKLRTIILQQVENQTILPQAPIEVQEEDPMDF